ncbi:hypothetical protein L1F30_02275 [Simiduia sp. 21SJ11W-1]|uniref:hypothetical protein n=1 Tax=Simiduia sp. 21SJ11W-1 TaxID=2909669 RepID=UPI00209DB327|nr:hypothetical protein [Simiduia sp. 21SJ11W-1]UTA48382.1 hypothetical protein L1F30_02275 [Simiduia sp. 21SJ11W-1]
MHKTWNVVMKPALLLGCGFVISACQTPPPPTWAMCEAHNQCAMVPGYYCGVVAINTHNSENIRKDIDAWYLASRIEKSTCAVKPADFIARCERNKCIAEKRES